jgi:hypothetical protein
MRRDWQPPGRRVEGGSPGGAVCPLVMVRTEGEVDVCRNNACGCGGGSPPGLALAAAAAVVLVLAEAAAAVIADTLAVVLVTLGLLNLGGAAVFAVLIRRNRAPLWRPERPAAIPATRLYQLDAGSPAAISTRRPATVTAIILTPEGES